MNAWRVIKHSPLVFASACVVAALIALVSEASYSRSINKLDNLETYAMARSQLLEVQLNLLEAETGQRGYLLTSQIAYLYPYQNAVARIDEAFAKLYRYYGANDRGANHYSANDRGANSSADSEPKKLLNRLQAQTRSKLDEMAETIRLHQAGESEAAVALVQTNAGKDFMDVVRDLTAQLLRSETQRIASVRANLYDSLLLSRLGLAALGAISLLALYLFLRHNLVLKQQELELKRVVQTESDRLGMLVNERTQELLELNQHLQTAREDERNRLARNLHDELGALLTSAKLDAARIKRRLGNGPPEVLERLTHLDSTLNSSIALGRNIIEDLRPSTLNTFGLMPTLQILLREFSERSGVRVVSALEAVALTQDTELVVYRMVQEAITNISKYAGASTVWVSATSAGGQALITVKDNGVGFEARANSRSAYGLVGMHYRVVAAGGTLTVLSAPGAGTTLSLKLPVTARAG